MSCRSKALLVWNTFRPMIILHVGSLLLYEFQLLLRNTYLNFNHIYSEHDLPYPDSYNRFINPARKYISREESGKRGSIALQYIHPILFLAVLGELRAISPGHRAGIIPRLNC